MDFDVDMDLDIDPVEDYGATESQIQIDPPNTVTDLPSDLATVPHKIHARGLDNLTNSDLKTYATEHVSSTPFISVEWIDDSSANLVYENAELAFAALTAFYDGPDITESQITQMQMLPAKRLSAHPETKLEIRLAVAGDKKQAGARERSRFYLFNPEYDRSDRKSRDRYHRKDRYNDRRIRTRDHDRPRDRRSRDDYDADFYDDDEVARSIRVSKSHSRASSRSSVESRGLSDRQRRIGRRSSGKELFPDLVTGRQGGRLRDRDRSASPINLDRRPRSSGSGSAQNRLKAQMIKAILKDTGNERKELFPQKASIVHRRSDAFDAADVTADLFSKKMAVFDGSSDFSSATQSRMRSDDGRLSKTSNFNIKGAASRQPAVEFSIKGISGSGVKELFPDRIGQNSGKELFSEKLEGRGAARRKAEDMFL